MKIELGNFILCDGIDECPEEGIKIDTARQVQSAPSVRASAQQNFSRGNRQVTVSFQVKRAHPSPTDAEAFAIMHESQIPEGSGLTLTLTASDKATVKEFSNACLQQCSISADERITTTDYTILASEVVVE